MASANKQRPPEVVCYDQQMVSTIDQETERTLIDVIGRLGSWLDGEVEA